MEDLAQKVSALRGRRVRLIERGSEVGSFGCLIPMPQEDLVVFHASSAVERRHIVFHEMAHVFLDHLADNEDGGTALMCGFEAEHVDPQANAPATMYETTAEWEAETAATILSEWSSSARNKRKGTNSAGGDVVLDQLDGAFGDLRGYR